MISHVWINENQFEKWYFIFFTNFLFYLYYVFLLFSFFARNVPFKLFWSQRFSSNILGSLLFYFFSSLSISSKKLPKYATFYRFSGEAILYSFNNHRLSSFFFWNIFYRYSRHLLLLVIHLRYSLSNRDNIKQHQLIWIPLISY